MISYEIRQAILTLKQQGRPLREIGRILKVSRNTVRRALRESEPKAPSVPCGQEEVIALLPEIYQRCKGNAVRIQEILQDEHATAVPYSTLTHLIREQELREPKRRSGIYTFGPGAEMQHDTSPHRLELGEKTLTRCPPRRAKRGRVVRGRRRSGRVFVVAKGGVSRSRGENLQGHPTRRQAIVGGVGLGVCLSSPAPTAGRAGAQRLSRRRVDFGDRDVPKSFTR